MNTLIEEPRFYVNFGLRTTPDSDFEIVGIFTKKEDATLQIEELCHEDNRLWHTTSPEPEHVTMRAVEELILAEAIDRSPSVMMAKRIAAIQSSET